MSLTASPNKWLNENIFQLWSFHTAHQNTTNHRCTDPAPKGTNAILAHRVCHGAKGAKRGEPDGRHPSFLWQKWPWLPTCYFYHFLFNHCVCYMTFLNQSSFRCFIDEPTFVSSSFMMIFTTPNMPCATWSMRLCRSSTWTWHSDSFRCDEPMNLWEKTRDSDSDRLLRSLRCFSKSSTSLRKKTHPKKLPSRLPGGQSRRSLRRTAPAVSGSMSGIIGIHSFVCESGNP